MQTKTPKRSGQPLYQQIKQDILRRIESGEWRSGDRVASEHQLLRQFGVSRMTVHRAVRELTAEGYLTRTPGVGTFVADRGLRGHFMEIRNIAEEIVERGGRYRAEVVVCEPKTPELEMAQLFRLRPEEKLFHTVIIHQENGQPLQLEDRWVNPMIAPDYLEVDFENVTPHEHLMQVAPLHEAEHLVRAIQPEEDVRHMLQMEGTEPCLLIERKTWTRDILASSTWIYCPGSRYHLRDRFVPRTSQRQIQPMRSK